jgi:hypothetical protein
VSVHRRALWPALRSAASEHVLAQPATGQQSPKIGGVTGGGGVLSRLLALEMLNNVEANHISFSLGQKLDDVNLTLSLLQQCLACMLRVRHTYFSKKSPCG